jgi:hypothetical protein
MAGFVKYRTYSFVDKDPIIDKVRTAVKESGMSKTSISVKSGVSTSCMHNWFDGATRRPQFASVNAVLRACDKELRVVDRK